jgi:sugar phosphate isomerase/epimerase
VTSGMIAGFGFSTIQRRDLSDLDEILSRIEDLGATHAELSLGGADLVCGGRLLSHRVDRLARICARHRLAYTAHGPLTANFMDPVHLDAYKAAVAALLEVCGAVGATVLVSTAGGLPPRRTPSSSVCTPRSATRCARWARLAPDTA